MYNFANHLIFHCCWLFPIQGQVHPRIGTDHIVMFMASLLNFSCPRNENVNYLRVNSWWHNKSYIIDHNKPHHNTTNEAYVHTCDMGKYREIAIASASKRTGNRNRLVVNMFFCRSPNRRHTLRTFGGRRYDATCVCVWNANYSNIPQVLCVLWITIYPSFFVVVVCEAHSTLVYDLWKMHNWNDQNIHT